MYGPIRSGPLKGEKNVALWKLRQQPVFLAGVTGISTSIVMVTGRWSDDSSTCVNGSDICIMLLEIIKFRVQGFPYPVVMRVRVYGAWM